MDMEPDKLKLMAAALATSATTLDGAAKEFAALSYDVAKAGRDADYQAAGATLRDHLAVLGKVVGNWHGASAKCAVTLQADADKVQDQDDWTAALIAAAGR